MAHGKKSSPLNNAVLPSQETISSDDQHRNALNSDDNETEDSSWWSSMDSIFPEESLQGTVSPIDKHENILNAIQNRIAYSSWWSLIEICLEKPLNGLMEKRGGALIDTVKTALADRMRKYCDPALSWTDFAALETGMEVRRNRFSPEFARKIALNEGYSDARIRHYAFKPMDNRWCYYTQSRPIWNDPRLKLEEWRKAGNEFFVTRSNRLKGDGGVPAYYTRHLGDSSLLLAYAYFFPLFIEKSTGLRRRPNLSRKMTSYLAKLGFEEPAMNCELASLVWHHVLAVTYSPAYFAENALDYQDGYVKVPFPFPSDKIGVTVDDARRSLAESAALGGVITRLLDTENQMEGITFGELRTEFLGMARLERERQKGDKCTVCDEIPLKDWGRKSERGAVLPGFGPHVERNYNDFERFCIESGALAQGVHTGAAFSALGGETYDVYLNGDWRWRNIPSKVWKYTIGGYPVLQKWLSYRDISITNRGLSSAEMEYFAVLVRRLAALCLLESRLNRNYAVIRDCAGSE